LHFFLLWLPLATGGCTGLLWNSTDFNNRPAGNPNVRLFQAEQQKDLLVVYQEYCERTRATRARAYLLYENDGRVKQVERPHFTDARMAKGLPEVPVYPELLPADTNSLPPFYSVVSTNTASFVIYSNNVAVGSHDLPFYPDPVGEAERAALSPVAITADVAIAAVVVAGVVYFCFIAPDNETWPSR
jgi:hypothetical protein